MTTYELPWTNGEAYTLPDLRRIVANFRAAYHEARDSLASTRTTVQQLHGEHAAIKEEYNAALSVFRPLWIRYTQQGVREVEAEYNEANDEYTALHNQLRVAEARSSEFHRAEQHWEREEKRTRTVYQQARADVVALEERWGFDGDADEEILPLYRPKAVSINSAPIWERREKTIPSTEVLQDWCGYACKCFDDYTQIDFFPEPPAWQCGNPLCDIQGRQMAPCKCNIKFVFEWVQQQGGKLRDVMRDWEPEKFRVCPGMNRNGGETTEMYMAKALEVWLVLEEMCREREEKRARQKKRAREEEGAGELPIYRARKMRKMRHA